LQRLAWRKDSCQECIGPGGEDLSGGYYEAGGSYLKFTFPTAFTITQLSWGVVEYRDGYEKVHELREALETIRWGTDYLLACISGPDKIVAMFGSSEVGHQSSELPLVTVQNPLTVLLCSFATSTAEYH
jgi:endoglucanase